MTVRDLFGSMPVRVKQRAIAAERGHHSRDWEVLQRAIVALVLSWNGPISISAREYENRWSFSVRGSDSDLGDEAGGINLAARASKILFQAGLAEDNNSENWVPLKASAGMISVAGAVSLRPIATRRIQFISIGVRPVTNEHGSNILYEEINRIFSNSTYGVEEEVEDLPTHERERRANDGRYKKEGFTSQELRGRKGVDRWPIFYIRIQYGEQANSIALQEIDEILDERYDSLAAIVDILKAVTYEFLKKYHFRPKRIRNTRDNAAKPNSRSVSPRTAPKNHVLESTSTTTLPRRRLAGDLATTQLSISRTHDSVSRSTSPFDLWARIKSGSPHNLPGDTKLDKQRRGGGLDVLDRNTRDSITNAPSPEADGKLLGASLPETAVITDDRKSKGKPSSIDGKHLDKGIPWTNPATKETSMLDPRTGFVIRSEPNCHDELNQKPSPTNHEGTGPHSRAFSKENEYVWLEELMSSWENPVFKAREPRIPCIYSKENRLGGPIKPFEFSTVQESLEKGSSIQGRVSRVALQNAEVIAQVDRKFILAKVLANSKTCEPGMRPSAASLLVMVDQHAADERCQVESLMKGYFEPKESKTLQNVAETSSMPTPETSAARTELLERPIKFDVSPGDAAQFERTTKHFTYWGIHFHVVPMIGNEIAEHRQLKVTRLPPGIAERCRLEPRLLIELLRKEAWGIDEQNYHQNFQAGREHLDAGNGRDAAPHWITRFHGCPEGILDMINSRACRSSIMFNDPLSHDECVNLVKRLADCVFPFQCAHGRPSMIPLVDLRGDTALISDESCATGSFAKRFKAWSASGREELNEHRY